MTALAGALVANSIDNGNVAYAATGDVAISIADGSWNPFGWGTKSVSTSGLVDTVAANNQANLWSSDFLNFNKHDVIDLEISLDSYDSSTVNLGNNSDGLNIEIKSSDNNTTYGVLQIWTSAWGVTNGTHSMKMYGGNYTTSTETATDFPVEGEETNTNSTIKGDATSSSSFFIRLSKAHGIGFKNSWDKWSFCSNTSVTEPLTTAINNGTALSVVIGADGGFARETKITLKSYNGQSFANDGVNFTDNVGPEIVTNTSGGDIPMYTPLGAINANAQDVFSGDCTVTKKYNNAEVSAADAYFPTSGSHTLELVASDGVGNSTSKSLSFNVTDPTAQSFAQWMLVDHSASCDNKYATAKNMFKALSADEKTNFQNGYADANARYVAWCNANGDVNPYDGGDPVSSSFRFNLIDNNNNTVVVTAITIISAVSIVSLLAFLMIKRRKKQH